MFSRSWPAPLVIGLVLSWLELIPLVAAQVNSAVCASNFQWMNNQKGQSPCVVAAYLIGACLSVPQQASVSALEPSLGFDQYIPPGDTLYGVVVLGITPCGCSTVLYSALNACGVCQNAAPVSWPVWDAQCSTVYVAQFPAPIPSAISVPQWAYTDPTKTGNTFDASAAQALAAKGLPDFVGSGTTAVPVSHSTVSVPTIFSTPAAFTNPGGSSPTFIPTEGGFTTKKKKTNVGAIVGGVVGGVVGLLGIIGGYWRWLTRRRHAAAATTAQPGLAAPLPSSTPDIEKPEPLATPPISDGGGLPPLAQFAQVPVMPVSGRPYDPDDPATYPDAQLNFATTPSPPIPTPSPPVAPVAAHPAASEGATGYVPTQY